MHIRNVLHKKESIVIILRGVRCYLPIKGNWRYDMYVYAFVFLVYYYYLTGHDSCFNDRALTLRRTSKYWEYQNTFFH